MKLIFKIRLVFLIFLSYKNTNTLISALPINSQSQDFKHLNKLTQFEISKRNPKYLGLGAWNTLEKYEYDVKLQILNKFHHLKLKTPG